METKDFFEKHGAYRVEKLVDEQTILVISQYFENKIKRGEWTERFDVSGKDYDPTSKYSYYADPLIEVFLLLCQKNIEDVVGKELIPTYSFARIYQPGECLKVHVDRPSCEISVTVNVATKGDFSPIYTQYGENLPEKHILNPGDAVIYKGCSARHWREHLKEDQLNVQFMLHYVDKNGSNAHFAKDNRPSYGMQSSTRDIKRN